MGIFFDPSVGNLSQNQMLYAGLNLMGGQGFGGAAQGLAQGGYMDERAAEAEQKRKLQEQMAILFGGGTPAGGGAGTPAGGPTIAPQPQPVPVTTQPLPPQGPGAPIPLVPPGMMAGGGGGSPAAMGQAQAYGGVPPSAALKRRFGSAKAGANYGMGAGSATGNPMASASRASAPGAPVGYGRQETRLGGDYWREFGGARPPVAPAGGAPGPAGVQVSPLGPIPTGGAPMAPTPVSAAQPAATGRQQALGASPGAGFGLMDMIRGMDPATRGLLAAMPAEQSLPLMFGMLNQRNQPGKTTAPKLVEAADGYQYWVAPGQEPQRAVPGAQMPPEEVGGPYEGTGMAAQDRNELLTGDPSTAKYASAYAAASQPKTYLDQTSGQMVTVSPDISWARQPTGGAAQPAPSGAQQAGGTVQVEQVVTPKATEGERTAEGFVDRMQTANTVISELEDVGSDWYGAWADQGSGNIWKSSERQRLEQAQRSFVNAVLRQESGAVISDEEFDNAAKQYFPQPGDGPEVIEQKRQERQTAIRNMQRSATPGGRETKKRRKWTPEGGLQ